MERRFSEETAQAIKGMQVWITSEYKHNALRAEGEIVLGKLLGLLRGQGLTAD